MLRSVTQKTVAEGTGETDWEAKRAQILRCAADVFLRRGFERGTTKEVAELAGLSQSSIYHYVGAKSDLLSGLAEHINVVFSAALNDALDQSDVAVEQFRCVIFNFVHSQVENLGAWTVYWEEQHSIPAETAAAVIESKRRFIHRLDDLVRRCQDSNDLPRGAPSRILTEGIMGALSSLYRWYRADGPFTEEQIIEAFWTLFRVSPHQR
jgi:TetR/AcrR family transcriptional regulator, cholesterol catabolism regulator